MFNHNTSAILPKLWENFKNVSVEVIQCPDLTQPPFNLVASGLNGEETVIDVGDITSLLPIPDRNQFYDVKDLTEITGSDPLSVIGPCGGPWQFIGADSESVINLQITGSYIKNGSHSYSTHPKTKECVHTALPNDETKFSFISNFFTSNGFKGEVLKIVCEARKSPLSFSLCVQEALSKHYSNELVALGGVVLMENGKVKVHVVSPELDKMPLRCVEDFSSKWLTFVNLSPPIIGLGYLISKDPGLNLRLQHFHTYSDHGQGGHYHNDVEPNTIKYTAYFNVAKQLIKINAKEETAPKISGFF